MHVRDVLRSKSGGVIVIEANALVKEAMKRLVQHNIGSLPVIDDYGRMVGILSERDILRGLHTCGEEYRQILVSEVMTPAPVCCNLEDDVDDVMGHMSENRIAKVPVLDGTELVGIVSVGDVIKLMYERVNLENQHLMTYIHGSL